MKEKIIITSYKNPDLDGTACAIAYSEFMRKNGKDADVAIFGTPHREAQFVFKKFNIAPPINAEIVMNNFEKIILVDASEIAGISNMIDPKKVVEIIDHRKINDSKEFSNAKIQIELVGAAATLIAEKFNNSNTPISKDSAVLLYSAIISNTINLKANVTTQRDHQMVSWLKTRIELPNDYINQMFADKSEFKLPLKEIIVEDLGFLSINKKSVGIAQLEIINVEDFFKNNIDQLKKILKDVKNEKSLDFIFLTCIDLEKGFNKILTIDESTRKLVEKALGMQSTNGIMVREGIIMRKEIVPKIKEILSK